MQYKIEKLDNFGRGISHINNKIVFISNALGDEVVDATTTYSNKKFDEAKVNEIIEVSRMRIKPICPYFDICGGCNLLHMNYDDQLKFKYNKVKDIIFKYLKENIKVNDVIYSNQFNYRNKASFEVKEKLCYKMRKSTNLVDINYCYLLDKNINDIVHVLNNLNLKNINNITIRTGEEDIMVIISGNPTQEIIDALKEKARSIYVNDKLVYGRSNIVSKIGNYEFFVSDKSFFQVNKYNVKNLYDKVLEYAELTGNENILDLYCGTGTIGIYLSKYAKSVIGIEVNEQAIFDANVNKNKNNIENISFICDTTSNINNIENISFICDTTSNINNIVNNDFDVIIVDPPRSGLDKNTINFLINSKAKRIVYVSCDIMTLVRDLNILKQDYDIREITPVDMFPNTYHVECVCVLNLK